MTAPGNKTPSAHIRPIESEMGGGSILPITHKSQWCSLLQGLDDVEAGRGDCVIVDGPAGMGKTKLLESIESRARANRIATASWRATKLDHAAPLTTLLSAFGKSDMPVWTDPFATENKFGAIGRLRDSMRECTASRPLVVILDDVQSSDELSALALSQLVPGLMDAPVLWILARRPAYRRMPGHEVADLLISECYGWRVELEPLDLRAVRSLAKYLVGREPNAGALAYIERAGGNPYLIEELLVSLHAEGMIVPDGELFALTSTALPARFVRAIERHIDTLSRSARGLLEVGAVLGRPFTLIEAATMLGNRAVDLITASDEAIREHLLADLGHALVFRHELVPEAIRESMPGAACYVLQHEAANLRSEADDDSAVAPEPDAGLPGPGGEHAVSILREAVGHLATSAPGTAADLITRTLSMLETGCEAKPELAATAVRLLASVGRLANAREMAEEVLSTDVNTEVKATVLLGLSEALKHAGQDSRVVECTARALALDGLGDDQRAQLLAIRAHALLNTADTTDAQRTADRAVELARATDRSASLVLGLNARVLAAHVRGEIAEATACAHESVRVADEAKGEAPHHHPQLWLGLALAAEDRFTEAEVAFERGQHEAGLLGTQWSMPLWHCYRAHLWNAKGALESAAKEAETGLCVAEQMSALAMSLPLLSVLVQASIHTGDSATARGYLDQAEKLADSGVESRPEELIWPTAQYFAAIDEPAAAMAALSEWFRHLPDRLVLLTQNPGAGPRLVTMAQNVGAEAEARAVVDALSDLAARNRGVVSLEGAAAHAQGLLCKDSETLRGAVKIYDSSPRALDRAAAQEDLAVMLHSEGERRTALDMLEAAMRLYSAAGASGDVDRINERLDGSGWRRRTSTAPVLDSTGRLTEAELRVATLITDGKTNREVATELFVSQHTVDSHLRHIFTKLGISNRVALARWMILDTKARSVPDGDGTDLGRTSGSLVIRRVRVHPYAAAC